ncbi:GGDEF domain-containing protein [Pseudoalteromonas sp. T1lg23B]|uniref:GGDEF domain-containing protein n=1 Tax=Pseudoalteromonas sp. T1lg23B TaxID=2077097 RepID=UPI000CF6DC3F|nr:GGDEF domain-containing protein [Pseudoalteromonas sp. T1lg23B]
MVAYVQKITRPLGLVGALFGFVVLAGYGFEMEALYRPFTSGPATHPVTALCVLLVAIMLTLTNKAKQIPNLIVLPSIVLMLTMLRILDILMGSSVLINLTPFAHIVEAELLAGKSNNMGMNSSAMLLGLALSQILYNQHYKLMSQSLAFISLAIPMVSLTGYAYDIDNFYGQMSILTTTIGVALATACITTTADCGALRAILSPYIGGKIARLQTTVGYLFPTFMGYLMVKSLSRSESDLFGVFVIAICWLIIILVAASVILHERSDHNRRVAEYQLALTAMTEPLTGLANRRRFNQVAAQTLTDIEGTNQTMWLFIINLDSFKKVNDIGGHDIGDRVLVEVAKVIQHSVREGDFVSRIGGEEFAVILKNLDPQTAHTIAHSIRQNIENMFIEYWSEQHGPITASIGCSSSLGQNNIKHIHKVADMALHQAKNNGRNQVVFLPLVSDV